METDPAALAVVRDYLSLQRALRARADQLKVSRETIDQVTGLADGYASKLLASDPIKILGRQSFGEMLSALAVKLIMVQDDETYARFSKHYGDRQDQQVRRAVSIVLTSKDFRRLGSAGGTERAKRLSPERRKAIARRAAKQRWKRPGNE